MTASFKVRSSSRLHANIVETAVGAGTFKTLVAAVTAAGLADTLSGPGPFSVFAPTDEAFAKLPAGTVDGSYTIIVPDVDAIDGMQILYAPSFAPQPF